MGHAALLPSEIGAVAASAVQLGRYSALAIYVVVVYDWLLSLGDEYHLVVKARWTWTKVVYLICRYLPLCIYPMYLWAWILDHDRELCSRLVRPLYAFFALFHLSSQVVVIMRAYAFTGRRTDVLVFLSIGFFTLCAAELWLFGYDFILTEGVYNVLGRSGCFAGDAYSQNGLIYPLATPAGLILIGAVVLDTVTLLLVLARGLRTQRRHGSLEEAFIIQGIGAFVGISAVNLSSAILYLRPERQFHGVALPLILLSDVIACRLILGLRRKVDPTSSKISRFQSQVVREGLAQLEDDEESPDSPANPTRADTPIV